MAIQIIYFAVCLGTELLLGRSIEDRPWIHVTHFSLYLPLRMLKQKLPYILSQIHKLFCGIIKSELTR